MKVYLVTYETFEVFDGGLGGYYVSHVKGIFSTQEKAEQACRSIEKNDYGTCESPDWEEIEVDA